MELYESLILVHLLIFSPRNYYDFRASTGKFMAISMLHFIAGSVDTEPRSEPIL